MKVYINKKVNLHIKVRGSDLFYTAIVLEADDSLKLITIRDREGKIYSYKYQDIVSIGELRHDDFLMGVKNGKNGCE